MNRIFTASCVIMGLIAMLIPSATGGENFLPPGDFGTAPYPGQWEADVSWMSSRFTLYGKGAGAFLRVNEEPARLSAKFQLPAGKKKLELATRTRQISFQQGEKRWDIPTVVLNFRDANGKEISSGWKKTIKYRGGAEWKISKESYNVPNNAAQGTVEISYKGGGDFDLDWIQVYDPANPPEMKEDAAVDAEADQPAKATKASKPKKASGPVIKAKAEQPDEGVVLYDGLTGRVGTMPIGWKTLFGKQVGRAELVKDDDGLYMHVTKAPFRASHDAWMDIPVPTRVMMKVRVSGTAGLPKEKMPNISFVHGAVGGLEAGYAGNWVATGDTDDWVSIDKEFEAGRGIVRRMRITVGHPGDKGTIDVKDIKVIGFPGRVGKEVDRSAILGPNTERREVDRSKITGSNIDESKIKAVIHVDKNHPKANDLNTGLERNLPKKSIQSAIDDFRIQHSGFTGETKIVIHEGVYRPIRTIEVDNFMYATRKRLLVLEGATKGKVVISGSITEGFEPKTWKLVDKSRNIYRHDWTYDWGTVNRGYYSTPNILTHRRELIALNGKLLTPKILEAYNYVDKRGREYNEVGLLVAEGKPKGKPGYTYEGFLGLDVLEPGEFGVAERSDHDHSNSIFIRLPKDVNTIDGALIEVGYTPTLLRIRDKHNMVMRNLTFKHAASWYINYFDDSAVEIGPTPVAKKKAHELKLEPRNFLIEDCVFEDNNGCGLALHDLHDFDLRCCVFQRNGINGVGIHGRNGRINDIVTTQNNRIGHLGGEEDTPHGGAGISLFGMDMLFKNVKANNNLGGGLRGDVVATNIIFENCEFNNNQNRGMFHEISWGPILLKETQLIGNKATKKGMAFGLFLLNTRDVTLDNCIVANNEGYQISINHSTKRTTKPHFYEGGLEAPIPTSTGFRIINTTVVAGGSGDAGKIIGRKTASAKDYAVFVKEEWEGKNNKYWSPDAQPFDADGKYHNRTWTDLEGWKKATGSEKGSFWQKPAGDITARQAKP